MIFQCPFGTFTYTIQSGDTYYLLAQRFNTSIDAIAVANPGVNPNNLQIGQVICIPGALPVPCPYAYGTYIPPTENFDNSSIPLHNTPYSDGYSEQGPPMANPPSFTPLLSDVPDRNLKAVDPGAISPCLFRFTYIWLKNGQSFWSFLVYVGKTSVAGWQFTNRRWSYFGVDLNEIKSFKCY